MRAMQGTSTCWRWTIWIACFALLMNALAPSISHAMVAAHAVPASWEICRSAGQPEPISLGAGTSLGTTLPQDQVAAMHDCGYCLPHGASFALMPSIITGLGLMGGHALRPFLFYRAPQPLLALSAAPARGPPAAA
jgi:hypothetical protein